MFHLRRTCDVTGAYRETSLKRRHDVLLPGGIFLKILQNSQNNNFAGISFLIKLQAGNLKLPEAVIGDVRSNTMFAKISQISQESLFNKIAVLRAIGAQVLSCEICEIFKNNYFEEHLSMTASNFI